MIQRLDEEDVAWQETESALKARLQTVEARRTEIVNDGAAAKLYLSKMKHQYAATVQAFNKVHSAAVAWDNARHYLSDEERDEYMDGLKGSQA